MVRVLMVRLVREAPRVVRGQERAVQHQADGVVEPAALGERAVAALVGQLPDAGEDEALGEGVGCPGEEAEVGTLQERGLGGEEG